MRKFNATIQKVCFLITVGVAMIGCKGKTGPQGTSGTSGTTLPSFSSAFPGFPSTPATACSEQTNSVTPFLAPYTDCPTTLFKCTWSCYSTSSCTGNPISGPCTDGNGVLDTEDIVLPTTCDLSAAISVGFGLLAACAVADGGTDSCRNFGLSCSQ